MVDQLRQRIREIRAQLQAGHPENALEPARTLLAQYPEYPTAYMLLAEVYGELRQWNAAEEVLSTARQRFPRHRALERLWQQLRQRSRSQEGAAAQPPDTEPEPISAEVTTGYGHQRQVTAPLRLIEGAGDVSVRLRSTLMRLIPGLEFAPLRSESPVGRPYRGLPPPPPFPAELEVILREAERTPPPEPLSPLEELARRLEHARIPAPEEADPAEAEAPAPEETLAPSALPIVTETMARIYEQQGAYELALQVYQELARRHPERRAEYERAQARLQDRLRHADS